VSKSGQGQGYGRRLVTDCEREAKERGIQKLFVLTYQQTFFEKLGYQVADIKTLPEKVFKECVICPFYDNCNEIAMIKLI
jgi:amino-acid N-acetyltransferase